MLTLPCEAGTTLWGFQRGGASPLVKGGVKTPPAKWLRLLKAEKTDGMFMNEFLLVALVIIYLVITYVPISETPKGDWQNRRDDRFSHRNAETDAGTRS
jgi:hypothetical protein